MSAAALTGAAFVLSLAAFFVRTIGAALFAAVAFSVWEMGIAWSRRDWIGRRTAIASLLVGGAIAASVGFACRHALATPWYARAWQLSPAAIGNTLCYRVAEIGETFQNVSADAFPSTAASLPVESTSARDMLTRELHAIRYISGAIAIGLILMGIFRRRRFSHVESFLAAYVAILLIWPFTAVRFWAPVLPLLFGYAWIGLRSIANSRPALMKAAACYCVIFCLFGSVAMAQTLRASLFDRGRTWRESREWLVRHPDWLAAYERFGGERKP